MAEFQRVVKERQRMCRERSCADCPVSMSESACSIWMFSNPKKAEQIIMQWSAEHPPVTNGMKFREVFGEDMIATLTGEHKPLDEWLDAEYKGGQNG